ncbi:MAG: lipid-A-disaccharide synthase [Prochlorotrichaceae cyanobacterium]
MSPDSVRRIFMHTGEVSGDLQGSLLAQGLYRTAQAQGLSLEICGMGGDRMAAAGVHLLGKTVEIGSIGIWESLPYVLPSLKLQRQAQQYLRHNPPDAVILIDYMGPNIALGKQLRRHFPDLPLFYYIAPQEWVWSENSRNTNTIVNFADQILAIFPGEADYYQHQGAKVTWVGHPLLDTLATKPSRIQARHHLGIGETDITIVLLPASRYQELHYLLPILLEAAVQIQAQIPTAKFWLPLSQPQFEPLIHTALQGLDLNLQVTPEDSAWAIAAADLALTKSGTVNLELALQRIPQVVCYRVSPVTAWIARNILRFSIPFMSPPNLVLMEPIVPELLQEEVTAERICAAALRILQDPAYRQAMLDNYDRVQHLLGSPGVCDRAAAVIFQSLPPLRSGLKG